MLKPVTARAVPTRLLSSASSAKVKDLGLLKQPGKVMAGKTYSVKAGEGLRFASSVNQIYGVIDVTSSPKSAAKVTSKLVKDSSGGLGETRDYAYTVQVSKNARPGTVITVTTSAPYQSRNDPNYVFTFQLKVR